ncbi:hypothetical protein N3K66_005821 [Trichothecium roseum]|uniref:Uncharacterized protein n=1 Tax=Trichothecium roseum TaxID=47278 RepID=A0ACC0V1L9_9HYPO|nr:hypothetical protein N3K66_005821 [Trichothecium roseum]
MSAPGDGELDTELESFRQQWLSDLRSRNAGAEPPASQPAPPSSPGQSKKPAPSSSSAKQQPQHHHHHQEDEEDYVPSKVFDHPGSEHGRTLSGGGIGSDKKELVSALDHYEEAMEKEAQGNMGDSLTLYRRAYRLDNKVDRRYREKHFPHGVPKPSSAHPSSHPPPPPSSSTHAQQPEVSAAAAAAEVAAAAAATETPAPQNLSYADLITSFSSLSIEPLPPPVEGDPPPPCPIASLPTELLSHILEDVAVADVADFARLSLVCRALAYLTVTEQRVWRRVCTGSETGFGGMHYRYAKPITWAGTDDDDNDDDAETHRVFDDEQGTVVDVRRQRRLRQDLHTLSLTPSPYPTWQDHFRRRPRVRFNGAYISTVNYVRSGQASTNQATWGGAPIHIVTYYRYLRFFRDGTCISLLSTSEPADVVHHLTKENLLHCREVKRRDPLHHHHQVALPSSVMSQALKGRWRLSSALEEEEEEGAEGEGEAAANTTSRGEGDLYVETEGSTPKYMYSMYLSLRSAGKGSRNNKVVWRAFYSYNKLTDDWAEFLLKNDKPFFFSRVKSYGLSE